MNSVLQSNNRLRSIGMVILALLLTLASIWMLKAITTGDKLRSKPFETDQEELAGPVDKVSEPIKGIEIGVSDQAPHLTLSLEGKDFQLSSIVSRSSNANDLLTASTATYGKESSRDIQINPNIDQPSWESAGPSIIKSFSSFTTGTISISEDGDAVVTGQAQDQASLNRLLEALGTQNGFKTVDSSEVTLTKLSAPELVLSKQNNQATVTGTVANQQIKQSVLSALSDIFIDIEVTENIEVSPQVYTQIELYRIDEQLIGYSSFEEFEFRIENGSFTSTIQISEGPRTNPQEFQKDVEGLLSGLENSASTINILSGSEELANTAGEILEQGEITSGLVQSTRDINLTNTELQIIVT